MKYISRLLPFTLFTPIFALAAGEMAGVSSFIMNILNFMNSVLIPAIFALAFIVFLWGMFKTFILGGGNEEKQKEGKQLIMYSLLGFVIMVSFWGIVTLIVNGLNLPKPDPIMPDFLGGMRK